mmetsp:Transcript_12616/g.32590  ORF Transcript_12616/g.32590 Transcript_12616/m.32590 type:complete len:140 (-) Transcript_12616:590-1009(-)
MQWAKPPRCRSAEGEMPDALELRIQIMLPSLVDRCTCAHSGASHAAGGESFGVRPGNPDMLGPFCTSTMLALQAWETTRNERIACPTYMLGWVTTASATCADISAPRRCTAPGLWTPIEALSRSPQPQGRRQAQSTPGT